MQLARILDGRVAELLVVPAGFAPADCYHPAILAAAVEAPDDVVEGWHYDGSIFTPPEPVPASPAVTITYKSDIFRRCTDDEADQIEGQLTDMSTKLRRLFEAVTAIHSDAPEYGVLVDVASELFGGERAAELLAPSE